MYNFDKEFNIVNNSIHYQDRIIFLGSCFAQNMGDKLSHNCVNTIVNPFGIIFHPIPISNLLFRAINNNKYQEKDFFFHDNYWWNYEHHGSLAQLNLNDYVDWSNQQLDDLLNEIKSAKYIVLTFGTSYGYELTNSKSNKIVANCHKQTQNLFNKTYSTTSNLVEIWSELIVNIQEINPEITFICTVSPVRHFKDGLVNNSKSKANLIQFIHDLSSKFTAVKYYPIYELVVDILRDYSYFGPDQLHLNNETIDYVFDKMKSSLFCNSSQEMFTELDKIKSKLNHRPLHPQSDSYQLFLKQLSQQKNAFEKKFNLVIN